MFRLLIAVVVLALLTSYEWALYHDHILRFYSWDLTFHDRVIAVWSLAAKTVFLIIPLLVASYLAERLQRDRSARLLGVIAPACVLAWLFLDVRVQQMTGQHVSYYLARAFNDGATKLVGSPGRLLIPLLLPVVCIAGVLLAGWMVLRRFGRGIQTPEHATTDRCTPWLIVSAVVFVAGLLACRGTTPNAAALERLYASLPVQAFLFHPERVADDGRSAFGEDVSDIFRPLGDRFFQASRSGEVAEFTVDSTNEHRPHVVLLILESFRGESVTESRMPRVSKWAAEGLVAQQHYCGSNCSPQGGFALMYGQLAMSYDAVLDTGRDATLCALAKQLGYQTALFASCTFDYRRMSEFFAEPDFDQLFLSDPAAEQWPEADRECLDGIAKRLEESDQPQLLVGYLNSTHYDYRYPEPYEDLDVDSDVEHGLVTATEAERELRIRYRRTLSFMDDLLADFLASIDLSSAVVIVTGDHGEAIYDDGTIAHGSRLSEVQTRVPMFMRGAGIPVAMIEVPTTHVDILPTVADLVGASYKTGAGKHGVSLLVGLPLPTSRLLIHEYPDSWDIALINRELAAAGEKLMLNVDRNDGATRVLGFAGDNGLVTPELKKGPADSRMWGASFQQAVEQLEDGS